MSTQTVRYLSEKVVAEITGLSVKTLQQHRFLRKGVPYSKVGRAVRYNEADVLSYMERCRINPEE